MAPRGQEQNEQMRAQARAKITRAALEVFAEYGYHGATMKKITQATGLSYGLVYHYFASKEEIFFHLVDTALKISRDTWQEALNTPGTAWQKIEKLTENLVKVTFSEEPALYFLIMVQALTQGNGIPGLMEFIQKRSNHYDEFPMLLIEAQKTGQVAPGNPGVLSSTYFALFFGYSIMLFQDKELKNIITPEIFLSVLRK